MMQKKDHVKLSAIGLCLVAITGVHFYGITELGLFYLAPATIICYGGAMWMAKEVEE